MMPPADSALYSRSPGISVLRGEMAAAADGRTVLALRGETAVSAPGDVRLFIGTFGSERISTVFQGRIVSEEAADPSVLVSVLPADGREMCGPSLIEKTYPGPISLRVAFPAASEGTVEPLVVTGITGAGDIVYVQYLKDSSARFGLDHWGTGGPVSEAVDLAPPGAAREITVSHSGLLPPPDSEYYERHPECRTLREWVVVAVDGRPVLAARVQCYPSLPEQIATGSNPIGGSTTAARFSGTIEKVESASPELALRWAGGAR